MHFTAIKIYLRRLLWKNSRHWFNKLVNLETRQIFSIAILKTTTDFEFESPDLIENPILSSEHVTDVPAGFVADPFMIWRNDQWYMFFEVFSLISRLGEIGLAESSDGLHWEYKKIVLSEPFHLAYPYVFAYEDDVLMIPDSPGNAVRLYRAKKFPSQWEFVDTIVQGNHFSDSSVFYFENRWWMFTGWSNKLGGAISLRLFVAQIPTGPWVEHCKSPLTCNDKTISRPAGRVRKMDKHFVRFAQDAVPRYGSRVRAFKILQLTDSDYLEEELAKSPILTGSGSGWNADGMHHVDMHKLDTGEWLACVDGWVSLDDNNSSNE